MDSEIRNGVIWVRISDGGRQNDELQLEELQAWAARRGVNVVKIIRVHDSASVYGESNGKGDEFTQKRAEVVEGARQGEWNVVMARSLQRLSRKGHRDTDRFMEALENHDCELWSHDEPIVQEVSLGLARQMYILMASEMNREAMEHHSDNTKKGMAKAKAAGKRVGGRQPGARDKKPMARVNRSNGAKAAWSGPEAEARREAFRERNRSRAKVA